MAELPSDDENELNFSDYEADSDDDKGRRPTTSVIAHKEMKTVDISDPESDNEGEKAQDLEFVSISPPADLEKNEDNKEKTENAEKDDEKSFEPISPVSDQGEFEAISPPESPPPHTSHTKEATFENISDDENEGASKKPEELPEGKFSPPESEGELNFHEEDSNDSGYQIIPKKTEDENIKNNEKTEENEIEAPVPSPFSDLGDGDGDTLNDNNEGQIISDILQHTDATEQQLNQINNGAKKMPSDLTEKDDVNEEDITKDVPDSSEQNEGDGTETNIGNNDLNEKEDDSEKNEEKIDTEDKEKEQDKEEENDHVENRDEENDLPVENGEGSEIVDKEDGEGKVEKEDGAETVDGVEKEALDTSLNNTVDGGEASSTSVENDGETSGEKEKDEEKKDDEDEDGEDAGDLIADIFGDSDEEEEFEGFADEEMPEEGEKGDDDEDDDGVQQKPAPTPAEEEKKDESSDDEPVPTRDFVNDFDLMLEKKKAEKRFKRKRKDVDIISDNDEIIANMITQMKEAADEDRMLNQSGKAATKKLKMLPHVIKSLRKSDLQMTFIDCGILGGIKEWLTPLPDNALPHIHIRKLMLQVLSEFPSLEKSTLKSSGIGRAVMLLFKHPKETRENRYLAGKIISNWARPIFNVSTNFMDMSKEEREERDKKFIPQSKRRDESEPAEPKRNKLDKEDDDMENKPRRPGDPGWCHRARVPQASNRDYVNRPVSKVDAYETTRSLNTKKPLNRYEKHALKMKGKKGNRSKAMDISLSGSKMGL